MRRAMAFAALCGLVIGTLWAQQAPQPKTAKVTLLIPGTRCGGCVRALSASLQGVAGVKNLSDFSPQTKRVVVEYEIGLASLTQLVAAVASTKPLHGEPYAASVLLKVKGLTAENAAAVEQALKRVKGVANAKANPADGTVTVDLVVPKPEDAEKPDVSLDRLIGAVEGATGLSVEG